MRTIAAALLILALVGCGGSSQSTSSPPPPSSPAASASPVDSSSPAEAASPEVESPSPADSASPEASASPTESAEHTETASPTPAPEPTGLQAGWADPYQRIVDGPEGDLVVRTGDINNLGYGWPKGFTPFSGISTPVHPYPCALRPGVVPGTDRIMLGSVVTQADIDKGDDDGYSGCSKRDETMPEAITVEVGALPAVVHGIFVQMFLDDFQAPHFLSQFQVSLNGTRIPSFETTINAMDQTGPIGKLVTLRLLPEYWPLVRTGTLKLYIDDPTTHARDGYAVDFVRVLVNPHFKYVVSVSCLVLDDATSKPIAGASVAAAQVTTTTAHDGTCSMRGIPAGIVSVSAGAVGYDSQTQLLDLAAGQTGRAEFRLKRHRETAVGLRAQIARTGTVAIYGIHFDTASAKLRPDSIASLNEVLALVDGDKTSRWTIAGHTDDQGGAAYNLGLSDARAKSVVAWLVKHGVAANRLVAKGYGLTRPVADNATASGRALNRRVEVGLVK